MKPASAVALSSLFVACLMLCVSPRPAAAQEESHIAAIEPTEPMWGDEIVITYDLASPHAHLRNAGRILTAIDVFFSDGRIEGRVLQLDREPRDDGSARLRSTFIVPEGSFRVSCYFYDPTRRGDPAADLSEGVETIVRNRDGIPARGAYGHQVRGTWPHDEPFRAEIANHPDNYLVYGFRWWMLSNVSRMAMIEASAFEQILDEEIKHVRTRGGEDESALASLTRGYFLIDRPDLAVETTERLARLHPRSHHLSGVIETLLYAFKREHPEHPGAERLRRLRIDHMTRHPRSPFAVAQWPVMASDPALPLTVSKALFERGLAADSRHPEPHLYFAMACAAHDAELARGAASAARAATLLLRDALRTRPPIDRSSGMPDVFGSNTDRLLPRAYVTKAQLERDLDRPAGALASISAAAALVGEDDAELARIRLVEGEIWEDLGRRDRAELAFAMAALHLPEAEEALRRLYESRPASRESSFDAYRRRVLARAVDVGGGDGVAVIAAPPFTVTTLDGETLDLRSLRGKAVVLNFWFIGCAPCRTEIPALNRLVEKYEDRRDDVVFIAPALDGNEALERFVQRFPFDYRIAGDRDGSISRAYGVKAYPTHVFIDREGRIIHRIVGGRDDADESFIPYIERAMQRQ